MLLGKRIRGNVSLTTFVAESEGIERGRDRTSPERTVSTDEQWI